MMYDTMRLVRSDGRVLNIGHEKGWRLKRGSYSDWSDQSISVNTSPNVLTHGSSLVSTRLNEKDRTASAFFVGSDILVARSEATSFFNSDFTFKVYFTHLGRTRWSEGRLAAFSCPPVKEFEGLVMTFAIRCLDPLFRDVDGNESAFGDSVPMFGFPFVSHRREALPDGTKHPTGFMASKLIYDGKNTVWNNGDVETMYRIRIEADGTLKNPTIEKDGRHVRMLLTMKQGDVLEIDFESAPPKVTLNGANVIHYASRDSAFTKMQMQVGKNVFAFTVDNDENRSLAKVQVLFHKKYLGV